MPDDETAVASNDAPDNSAQDGANETPTLAELLAENEQLRADAIKAKQERDSANGRANQSRLTYQAVEEMEDRVANTLEKSMTAILNEDDPDERRRKVGEAFADQRARQEYAKRVNQLQPMILRTARKAGLDWETSPELGDARDLWNEGRLDEALTAASNTALGVALERKPDGTFTKDEVDEAVAAAKRNASSTARRNVDDDQGEPPPPTGDNSPITQVQMASMMREYKRDNGGRPMPSSEMKQLRTRLRRG